MAEKTEKKEDAQANAPVQPQVTMHAQYIKDLSFESPMTPEIFIKQGGQPNVDIGVNVGASRLENGHFEVVLKIAATAKADDKTIFLIELSYAGVASCNVSDENMVHPLMAIEGPRLLFPFARSIVSTVTRDGGFMPLNLSPIDFLGLYQNNMRQRQKAAEAAQGNQKPEKTEKKKESTTAKKS